LLPSGLYAELDTLTHINKNHTINIYFQDLFQNKAVSLALYVLGDVTELKVIIDYLHYHT